MTSDLYEEPFAAMAVKHGWLRTKRKHIRRTYWTECDKTEKVAANGQWIRYSRLTAEKLGDGELKADERTRGNQEIVEAFLGEGAERKKARSLHKTRLGPSER
ncbi:hypothetical protein B0H13DRAFT_1888603 [Mycena leptocephala]|nr:hypothetical protein B0H13DRAFT_1888603 [Mycena leptocephala]